MNRGRLIVTALLVALTALLTLAGVSAEEMRVIQLKHRPASEIIPLIRPLLGPEDALSGTDYRLIIRTSDRNLKDIERLLAQLDVAHRQLRITVEQGVADDRVITTHSVEGEVPIGDKARIKLPERSSDNRGLVVQKDSLRFRTDQRSTAGRNVASQTVMALDGQRASIRIGQSVPHVKKILAIGGRQVLIAQGIELQDVTTGFDVLPRLHGNRVRMEITPRLSTLRDPATGLADFHELATTVEARLGEWIDLGMILGQRNDAGRAILESAATESGERRTIRLKIE
jgi:type II secretory pathway component GspD/PulD (secretin)